MPRLEELFKQSDIISLHCPLTYININEWGFTIVKNNEELNSIISKLDLKEQELKMIKHNIKYGSYEKGNATQTIWCYMKDFINKR